LILLDTSWANGPHDGIINHTQVDHRTFRLNIRIAQRNLKQQEGSADPARADYIGKQIEYGTYFDISIGASGDVTATYIRDGNDPVADAFNKFGAQGWRWDLIV